MEQYDVLILGGGFAGFYTAKYLERNTRASVAIADRNGYFLYAPSLHQLVISPDYIKRIAIPFSEALTRTAVITDEIVKIEPDKVTTKGKKLGFRFLVIALGSSYPVKIPGKDIFTLHSAESALAINKAMRNAESIAIAGGGLIGVELAAEMAVRTGKKITLIESNRNLLSRNPGKAGDYAKRFLEKRKVRVLTGQRISARRGNSLATDSKIQVRADLAVWCGGIVPNTGMLGKGFEKSIDQKGHIIVNELLQVSGHDHIFAAGDLTSLDEEKTAQNAKRHSAVVGRNLRLMISGKKPSEKYRASETPLVISLGPWDGIFVKKNFVLGGIVPGILKHAIEKIELWRAKR